MEYEGVVVEETSEIHHRAWLQLADEEGKPAPMQWALKRADGMKAEQVRLAAVIPPTGRKDCSRTPQTSISYSCRHCGSHT